MNEPVCVNGCDAPFGVRCSVCNSPRAVHEIQPMNDDEQPPEAHWAWHKSTPGHVPSFDQDAAREAACADDPNPKGSPFHAGKKP